MEETKAKTWSIYLISNTINPKTYIGRSCNFKKRIREHKSMAKNPSVKGQQLIHKAIRQHGLENFKFEEIHTGITTQEEAAEWELFYVKKYNSFVDDGNGYNVCGNFDSIYVQSKENCEKKRRECQGICKSNNRKSQYMGVQNKNELSFTANITYHGETIYKNFASEIDCAESYDKIILFLYGTESECRLNFPEKKDEYLAEDLESFYKFFKTPKLPTRKVFAYNPDGIFIKEYKSSYQALHIETNSGGT